MHPKETKVITPDPFYKIAFGCSNRAFYEVKGEVIAVAESIGVEWNDGYLTERCDYEGDLECIILYRGERENKLVEAVLEHYGIKDVPQGMNVHLSIF